MKRLDKEEKARRDSICAQLQDAREELDGAIAAYNEAVTAANETLDEHWGKIDDAVGLLNTALDEARSWATDMAEQVNEEIGEHTEKWLEGERGQAFDSWRQAFEDLDSPLSDFSAERPDTIPEYDPSGDLDDYAQLLWDAPEEP